MDRFVERFGVLIGLAFVGLSIYFIFDILTFVFTYFWYIVGIGIASRLALAIWQPSFDLSSLDVKDENQEAHYRVLESDPGSGYKHFWIRKY